MKNLNGYVGRMVKVNADVFRSLHRRTQRRDTDMENRFIVAAVSREMRKLICYGANTRIAVGASEVVLI